ncbi:hypothetical protein Cni_G10247 [Canna indica]|uniref:Uncharacterized protein n=1 Tax=Canna indica TaxID=4628 RepID=A0AAQ3QAH0_9LILI|nr:hypothetical protein Cni_G10247 [Canna indica]
MGCGISKADQSELLALCRERVELIRTARDGRYALAAAHAAYFRALAAVGDALQRFVQEELVLASSRPGSPILVLPTGEGKGKPRSGRDSASAAAAASTSSSATPLSHSLSPEDSHLPLSPGSESEASPPGGGGPGSVAGGKANSGAGGGVVAEQSSSPRQNFWPPSPNSYSMRSTSAIPTMIYQDPFAPPWSNSSYNDYEYGFYPPYGVSIGSPPRGRQDTAGPSVPAAAPGTPPPPQHPGTSSWDFLDPFISYEEFLPDYYEGKYGVSSSVSSPDLSEVRKREGIPDLEDEAQVEQMKAPKNEKVQDNYSGVKDQMVGGSNRVSKREFGQNEEKVGDIGSAEKRSSSAGSKGRSSGEDEGSSRNKKGVTFEDVSYATEENGPSRDKSLSSHSDVQPLFAQRTRDVMEVVQEIKENFVSAAGCGEEVSRLLELDKLPYKSRSRMNRVVSSRIFGSISLPWLVRSHSLKWSQRSNVSRRRKPSTANNHTTTRSSSLSSTLEKLYLWEKKLFKEVKDEEKLRVRYEKEYRRFRTLTNRGEDNSKIDSSWASIRKLRTKISITIKSVNAISSRMHRIRDEELQPQLVELIQGFRRMWKSVLDCHQKQLQALVACKNHSLLVKNSSQKKSAVKATKELELELVNWRTCFYNWISIQKSYIEAFNGWQMKWLLHEQEQTADGPAPFSPTRIGAPSVFIISSDWYHAINNISEEKVIERMHAFIETVHLIRESQDQVQHLRLEEDRLSQVYSRRLKSMQLAGQTNGHLQIVSGSNNGLEHDDDSLMALRKRLDEKRGVHKETLERLQKVASSILPTFLIPTFEQLATFTSEALQAYNGIRTTTDSGGTQHTIT